MDTTKQNIGSAGFKILRVEDTREYEEIGDKWVAIPGSGKEQACNLCGKSHEIIFTVKCLATNTILTVGGSCARSDNGVQKSFNGLAMAAKRIKINANKITGLKERYEQFVRASYIVKQMQHPDIIKDNKSDSNRYSDSVTLWYMGEVFVLGSDVLSEERKQTLIESWERRMIQSMGINPMDKHLGIQIAELEKHQDKLIKRMEKNIA